MMSMSDFNSTTFGLYDLLKGKFLATESHKHVAVGTGKNKDMLYYIEVASSYLNEILRK